MSTATLEHPDPRPATQDEPAGPEPFVPDAWRAVRDLEHYNRALHTLTGPQLDRFRLAVDLAYDTVHPPRTAHPALSDADKAILAFAVRRFATARHYLSALDNEMHMTPAGYATALSALIGRPEAYRAEPALIGQLRRRRTRRPRSAAS